MARPPRRRVEPDPAEEAQFHANLRVQLSLPQRVFSLIQDPEGSTSISINPPIGVFGMSLTILTIEELDALERFWTEAIRAARPVCTRLDADAQAAYETGDRTFRRLYRPRPTYVEL